MARIPGVLDDSRDASWQPMSGDAETTLPMAVKEGAAGPPPSSPEGAPRGSGDALEERAVRCAACGHALARERDRLPLDTSTFVNPEGVVHTIAAFRQAEGCAVAGDATTYWTWFPGHAWRYALCGKCGVHVGWAFTGPSTFLALLTARIAG
ncbi:MAG: cereblon family protein [Myxococcales bacterium]